jgi:hypothetical protein
MRAVFYHGVVDRAQSDHYYASIFADRRRFEDDVAELARHWHPMPLAEIQEYLRQDLPLPARAVHVSFDDGFANTMDARHRLLEPSG